MHLYPSDSCGSRPGVTGRGTSRGVEGVYCFPRSLVARIGVKRLADAVTVQLPSHSRNDGAHHEPYVPLTGDLYGTGKDRESGVVDVLDRRAIEDKPAQRPSAFCEGAEVGEQPGRVGVVEARAEPGDDGAVLGARAPGG